MNEFYDFPDGLRTAASAALLPGEVVRWSGRPHPGRTMRASLPVLLFGIPWLTFSLFFFFSPVAGALGLAPVKGPAIWGAVAFSAFAVPFVAIGVAITGAPLFARWQAARTGFLVTDQRVVEVRDGRAVIRKALAAQALRGAETIAFPDGTGTVKALGPIGRDSDGDPKTDDIAMIGINDPAGAEQAIWRLVGGAKGRALA